MRTLEIGQRNAELAEVEAGIQPGEKVIIYPSGLIIDGVRVDARLQRLMQ